MPIQKLDDTPTKWDDAIGWSLAFVVFIMPLIVVPQLNDSFTLPKVFFLRVSIAIVVSAWLLKGISSGFTWRRSQIDLLIVGFASAAVLATLFSTNPRLSIFGHYKRYEDIVTLISYALLFFTGTQILSINKQRERVIAALVASASIIAGYGLAQYFGFNLWRHSGDVARASSTLGNAVFLGSFLVLILPIAISRLINNYYKEGSAKRWLYGLATLTITAGALVTFSRSAWLGGAVGLIFFVLTTRKAAWRRSLPIVISIFLVIVVILFVGRGGKNSSKYTFSGRAVSSFDLQGGTVKTRLILWKTTLSLIAKRPLLGYGPDSMGSQYPRYLPMEARAIERATGIDKAHNDLLQTAATTGLVGSSFYLMIIFIFFYWAATSGRRLPSEAWSKINAQDRAAGFLIKDGGESPLVSYMGLTAGALAYITAIQFSFSQVEVASMFWLVAGMAFFYQPGGGAISIRVPRLVGGALLLIWLALAAAVIFSTALKPIIADRYFSLGLNAENGGDLNTAVRELEKAVNMMPGREIYVSRLARAQHLFAFQGDKMNKRVVEKALANYEAAEKLDPYSPVLYTDIGSLYTLLGRQVPKFNDLAIRAFERSISLDPFSGDTYLDTAVAYEQKDDTTQAISYLNLAILYDANSYNAHYNLAVIYNRQGKYSQALANADKALKLNPRDKKIKVLLKTLKIRTQR